MNKSTLIIGLMSITLLGGPALAKPMDDPMCQEHVASSGSSLKKGSPMRTFWDSCQNNDVFRCSPTKAALAGKAADAGAAKLAVETMHYVKVEGKKRVQFCVAKTGRGLGDRALTAATILESPTLLPHLKKMLDKDEFTYSVTCDAGGPDIRRILQTLYNIGAKEMAPKIVHLLEHKAWHYKCDRGSFASTLPWLHKWNIDAALTTRVVKLCTEQVLPNLTPRHQGTNIEAKYHNSSKADQAACMRFIGMNNVTDEAALRFLEYAASPKSGNPDAYRMMGRLNPKRFKAALLLPVLHAKRVRGPKQVQYKDLDTAIAAAVGLNAIGDKEGKAAVAYWLGAGKGGYYASESGFRKVFMAAATAQGTPAAKKLMGALKKAYKGVLARFAKGDSKAGANMVGTAAAAMLQLGDGSAIKGAKAVLEDTNSQGREALLMGLGGTAGTSDFFLDGWEYGAGGITVGKGGLKPKDAGKLLKLLQSKVSMFSDRSQRPLLATAIIAVKAAIKAGK